MIIEDKALYFQNLTEKTVDDMFAQCKIAKHYQLDTLVIEIELENGTLTYWLEGNEKKCSSCAFFPDQEEKTVYLYRD